MDRRGNDATFAQVVDTASMPVLVDLWAPWCGPCRTVSPTLEQLARTYRGRVKLVKVNVDESPVLSRRFVVQDRFPLLLLSGGEVMARQTGAAPEAALRSWLDDALAQVAKTRLIRGVVWAAAGWRRRGAPVLSPATEYHRVRTRNRVRTDDD